MKTAPVWLSGFLLLGSLIGLLGSLVVAWQYHIDVDTQLIGLHFLCLNAGYVIAAAAVEWLCSKFSSKAIAVAACVLACTSLLTLAVAAPPVHPAWRLAGLAALGSGAGALGSSLLFSSREDLEHQTGKALARIGQLFGIGCLLSTVIMGSTYFLGSVQIETAGLALVPLVFALLFSLSRSPDIIIAPASSDQEQRRHTLQDLRSIATLLFSLLLFFQFGNEWAIAGWLPLFLIRKLGSNPAFAIGALAAYFLTITVGRTLAQGLMRRVNHRNMLLASIATAMCGFLWLSFAPSFWTASAAVILIAAGYAPIYPLIAERLDHRFSFHPGFYNGTVSVAITGAMSIPWLLGFVATDLGVRYVMLVPAIGSVIVLILSLLLMFEAHLMSDKGGMYSRSKSAGS
jgi:fucose permease